MATLATKSSDRDNDVITAVCAVNIDMEKKELKEGPDLSMSATCTN
jgi:hypothetical protein